MTDPKTRLAMTRTLSPEQTAALKEAIASAERGELIDLGSFAQYLEDED